MNRRVILTGKLNPPSKFGGVGAGKPSLNRAIESVGVDPKLGDLPMARVKLR